MATAARLGIRHMMLPSLSRMGVKTLQPCLRPLAVSRFHNGSMLQFKPSPPRSLLPPGPQVIQGTVNDPIILPDPSAAHGSYHWTFERLLSIGLIPLTIAPFVGSSVSPILDAALGAAIIIHSHIGFDSCIVDYVPKRRYGGLHFALTWILRGCTGIALYAVYSFETNDVGISEAIRRVWKA